MHRKSNQKISFANADAVVVAIVANICLVIDCLLLCEESVHSKRRARIENFVSKL